MLGGGRAGVIQQAQAEQGLYGLGAQRNILEG